tara:strand:+ start:2546 stop:3106 length:561 start_codon:yes stop_codon:yes gene_type:complete
MIRIGGILAVAIILTSIGIAFYFYSQETYREVVVSDLGEVTMVGDIKFEIQYVTNYEILEKTKEFTDFEQTQIEQGLTEGTNEIPEGTYFQIQITAENKGSETTTLTGGQFHLYDDKNTRYGASFVGYGGNELSMIDLEPNNAVTVTTQFDIPYEDEMKYKVGIVPNRFGLQETQEIAFICIKNCE